MASSGKKKTTMAKITRENRLRERRADKRARKDARKLMSQHGPELPDEIAIATTAEPARTTAL